MGLLFCIAGFVASYFLGRRSQTAGLGAVLTVGYLYGILRANYLDTCAHFLFDCAVFGFYLSQFARRSDPATAERTREQWTWMWVLMGWAAFMTLLPLQHPLIQLVGLRGNAFLLPFLVIGGRLGPVEARRLALWIGVLNLMALGFAGAEYFKGVPAFYPKNAVTEIIYKSNDVAGYTAYRIPSCFVTAHAFAGTMVATLPWLLGAWFQRGNRAWQHALLGSAVGAAALGVFMAATRINMILLAMLLGLLLVSGRLRIGPALGLVVLLGGVGFLVSGEARLQRFLSLADTGQVTTRVEGSVNSSFVDLLVQYPIGNGMGAGGTSIPFFLEHLIHKPVMMENEYSRILLEQGLPGLALWAAFIVWIVKRRPREQGEPWDLGRRLLWYAALASFGLGILGIGMLTAIPQSAIFLLGIGYLTAPEAAPDVKPAPAGQPLAMGGATA